MIYGCRWVTGVPPGLQNLCWTLRAPWVSSILTGIRQKKTVYNASRSSPANSCFSSEEIVLISSITLSLLI